MTNEQILSLVIDRSDAGNGITIKQYLKTLLATLWEEGESFSGKRPFGNSGWQFQLYKPLIKYGAVEGSIDEDGFIDAVDDQEADKIIALAIASL